MLIENIFIYLSYLSLIALVIGFTLSIGFVLCEYLLFSNSFGLKFISFLHHINRLLSHR